MSGGKKPKKGSPGKVRAPRAGSNFRKLPGGGFEGKVPNKSRMKKVKEAPRVKSTKKGTKVTKRKSGGFTKR